MSANPITAIRQAIADALETIDGLQALRNPIGNPHPPTAWVIRKQTQFDETNARGTDLITFCIELFVGTAADTAQDLVDQFTAPYGPKSIKQAVEADCTLGGLVEDLRVTTAGPDHQAALATGASASKYLAVDFDVDVYAPGRP